MKKLTNTQKGKASEELAVSHLLSLGYSILKRNYRSGRSEIDILAMDQDELVVVEVKSRKSNQFGFPEVAISKQKEQLLREGGYAFKYEQKLTNPIRFDVISISILEKELRHFKDAF